jgi:3',5'-cyclic AMP phosphodiesterase CpdA
VYRTPVIAQISDLHFGKNTNPLKFRASSLNDAARTALTDELLQMEPRPDFLVVTGDVANRGRVDEMQEGKRFLESILEELWRRRHAARCILVPGNHDTWRTTWACPRGYFRGGDRLQEWTRVFNDWSFVASTLPQNEGEHVRPFSLLEFYSKQKEKALTVDDKSARENGRLEPEQQVQRALRVCEYFPKFNLAFVKLDSNVKSYRRPAHIARGKVGPQQQSVVDQVLRDYEDATRDTPNPFTEAKRIALVHHHLTRLPNVKLEKWMMMDDAGQIALWLARHGIRLVLHGHFHFADVLGLTYWNTEMNNSKVQSIIVSGGSGTAQDVDDGQNSYHIVALGNFRTNIRRRVVFPQLSRVDYEFIHKPNLRIEDDSPQDVPIFVEALEALVLAEEKYADQKHTYSLVKSVGYIDADRNYFGSVELHGANPTSQDSQWIPFSGVAVGAQYFEELDLQATDLSSGSALELSKVEQRPIYVFPFRIYKTLSPGAMFRIRVTFRLKAVMLNERDYDVMSLLRFPRGVGRAEFCLLSTKRMLGPSFWELRGDKLQRSSTVLQQVQRSPENPPLTSKVNGYVASIDFPPALAYLLLYDKLA